MPAYNVEAYVEKAIQSVLDQTYTHFELLVADDQSSDQTVEKITSFSDARIVCIKNTHNLGYADNMNALFKAAKGHYVVIQDADDYCTPNRLQVLVDFLGTHPTIDMVGSSYIKVHEQWGEEKTSMSVSVEEIKKSFEAMSDSLPVLNGSVMFRRKIIEQGFFFRKLFYINRSQDDDWLFRVSENFNLANVADHLYYYRFNPTSMTMNLAAINYYSIFSGDFVRFLKTERVKNGVDLLEQQQHKKIEAFFYHKKKELTDRQPVYLELYIAHKYLAVEKRRQALQWLFKALLKNPSDGFIWKKIGFVLLGRKN